MVTSMHEINNNVFCFSACQVLSLFDFFGAVVIALLLANQDREIFSSVLLIYLMRGCNIIFTALQ